MKLNLSRGLILLGAALSATFLVVHFSTTESASPDEVDALALVGGTPVTESNFRHSWAKRPHASANLENRETLLEDLIERTALANAARKAGLADDPIVMEQIQNLLIGRLKEIQLKPKLAAVTVADEEITDYYEAHKNDQFTAPARTKVAVLWLNTRGQKPLAARYTPRLEKIRDQLTSKPDSVPVTAGFGDFAIANSEHRSTRYQGGNLGWIESGRPMNDFHTVVAEIADGLGKAGDVSAVTEHPAGLFLVRLIARQDQRTLAVANVREKIRSKLLRERRDAVEESFISDLTRSVKTERFPEKLLALEGLETKSPNRPALSPAISKN